MSRRWGAAAAAASLLPAGCGAGSHVLRPGGEGAAAIALLTWVFVAVSVVVFVVVLVLLWLAARRPGAIEHSPESDRRSIRWVVIGGALVPAVILTVLFIATLATMNELAAVPSEDGLVVEVVGKQWWWEVHYRDGSTGRTIATAANEVHIPTGARVPVRLTATDVIHSFWVPGLQGKLDMVPGRTNRTWLQADEPGVHRGVCAEYCGLQHARMEILVVAHSPAEFERWLAREQGGAQPARSAAVGEHAAHGHGVSEGQRVFERAGCGFCHQIRGTAARGRLGPDLTHVGSRRTLAAGTLHNNRGNMAGWISNPQQLKPGAHMPRLELSPHELQQLATYLESLK